MRRTYSLLIFLLFLGMIVPAISSAAPYSAFSRDAIRDILSAGGGDICGSVQKAIGERFSPNAVVKTGIEMGHNSCLIIKCAVRAGGNLEDVVAGATEAGVSSDVVSRCCISGGADPREVSKNLVHVGMPAYCGLGYSKPEPNPNPPPPIPPPPPPPVSPYRFY